ncbi:DNA-directed RNA polymerase subunit omega [Virgibacillus kekensis]|uniref:DNA-directed RNA polymerase subunit omega n=1 Tax=Virgibacillus kekensis TaxID=202261 RepID=A0ABV9DGX2_9BACI
MILEPSIDSLQRKIRSKYTLVTLSARRARQMLETNQVFAENSKSHKFVGKALEEVLQDKLYVKEDSK